MGEEMAGEEVSEEEGVRFPFSFVQSSSAWSSEGLISSAFGFICAHDTACIMMAFDVCFGTLPARDLVEADNIEQFCIYS